jgi:membrane protease YdiL (CAAX protease family)
MVLKELAGHSKIRTRHDSAGKSLAGHFAAGYQEPFVALLAFHDGYGLASVAVFGFSCALLHAGSGSLTTVIALHMLYNSAIKIPEWIVCHAPLG